MKKTDQELLREYAQSHAEAAFAELVARYVDVVFSAANVIRSETRRLRREQEAAAMNELIGPEPEAVWKQIAPQLDEALGELSEADQEVVFLRYFEGETAREMSEALGTSEEAAQKRVHRAVERLREHFGARGIAVGAGSLVAALSLHAVEAAPVGLGTLIAASAAAGSAMGNVKALPADASIVAEKAPVDRDYDSRAKFGVGRSAVIGTGLNSRGDPEDSGY